MTTHEAVGVVYMIADRYGEHAAGPLLGAPGLDFEVLGIEYRKYRYAAAESQAEDWCLISTEEFVGWLIERGFLKRLDAIFSTVNIDICGENRYVPSHWPLCPECAVGRGDSEMGRVSHSLNRVDWHRKCTECNHTWAHEEHPYHSDRPMLEDDGREIDGGCVPYAISQAGEVSIARALEACRKYGWTETAGMRTENGLAAARECGLDLARALQSSAAGKYTLRKLFNWLSPENSYIVSIRGHWLAYVRGENRDQAETHLRAEVLDCWEVRSRSGSASN
jgi:hypothetical protein